MYDNFQQPTVYESPSTGPYGNTQPIYSHQYQQTQYANNPYMNQPLQPMYETAPNQPLIHSISTQQQFPLQSQNANNSSINQPSPPMYESVHNQLPIYSISTQQPQFPLQPHFVDNNSMNQQSRPTYQTLPQQPPPPYSMVVQSSPYAGQVQQQSPNNNPKSRPKNSKPQRTPFSNGYKWPRRSIPLICPQCGASVSTRVESSITIVTIIAVVFLWVSTCILACIPLCISACKRSTHYCPYCNSILGVRHALR